MDLSRLSEPFDPALVSWRVGSTNGDKSRGLALAYIDARDVMSRLDEVMGPANWQDRYEFHGKRVVCYLTLRIDGEWITKADGAGDSDVEAEKGAISDALKRAAVKWGIGRYLYDVEAPWVQLVSAGRSYKMADSEKAKLEAVLRRGLPRREDRTDPVSSPNQDQSKDRNVIIADTMIEAANLCADQSSLKAWKDRQKQEIQALDEVNRRRVTATLTDLWNALSSAETLRAG